MLIDPPLPVERNDPTRATFLVGDEGVCEFLEKRTHSFDPHVAMHSIYCAASFETR